MTDGNSGANYNVTFTNDITGMITALTTTSALLSSVNPSGPGTNVTFTLTFVGTPQAEYYLLASSDVTAPMTTWTILTGSTNAVTDVSGVWQFTVTNAAPQRYCRSTAVVPCP